MNFRVAGHGACAELLPELITLDEWGYPIVSAEPVPPELTRYARRAVTDCPALALLLTDRSPASAAGDSAGSATGGPRFASASAPPARPRSAR